VLLADRLNEVNGVPWHNGTILSGGFSNMRRLLMFSHPACIAAGQM
jgi:hypothetical protein